ncbi:hypothetical protein [Salinispora arenicola]|uniref:hypothetical protein n=1 Tax=Salinispora arenicola TaxID=168697 RepID=UPI00036FC184|nr:hypothetical protein [Salinispora arenicola]
MTNGVDAWLDLTPEATVLREALAARVAFDSGDDEANRRMVEQEHLAEQIMRALKDPGVSLVIRPDDIRFQDGDPAEPEDS